MTDPEVAERSHLKRLGERIASARRSQKLSLECLAELSHLDEKTIRTAISGQRVRQSSLIAICGVLKISLESEPESICLASARFGSYNLEHYRDYVGDFLAVRRSFVDPRNIIRTLYKFSWCSLENERRLIFEENHRYLSKNKIIDYSQSGDVYIHNERNIIQLLTSDMGDLRLISLARMQDKKISLSGIVATNAHLAFFNQPSASAIYFHRLEGEISTDQMSKLIGPIYESSPEHKIYDEILRDVEQNVGLFAISRTANEANEDQIASIDPRDVHRGSQLSS